MTDRNRTIRLDLFEVYEKETEPVLGGSGYRIPLFVTSDAVMARENMEEGDTMIRRFWVREGGS